MFVKFRTLLHKLMYRDRADIFRGVPIRKGNISDFNKTELAPIYTNIPCKLGFYRELNSGLRDERSMQVAENYRLDCDPCFDIRNNDVIVIRHCGQTFKMIVGVIFKYSSHQEINLSIKREAGRFV